MLKRNSYRLWWENLKEEDYVKDPNIGWRIILK
jgi:hypothetical protein